MEKLFKVAEIRDLEKQVSTGEISYSRMVEKINEKHFIKLVELRQEYSLIIQDYKITIGNLNKNK